MHRTPWELELHIRYRIAAIAADRTRTASFSGAPADRRDRRVHLKQALGLRLIQLGQHLAGNERGLLPPPAKPIGM